MTSPSKELADIIIQSLISDNLILEKDKASFQKKLEEGELRAEDWRLAIEKPLSKEVTE